MQALVIDTPNCPHHLDHLIPLCYFFNAPLFLRDPLLVEVLKKNYPPTPHKEILSLEDMKEEIGKTYSACFHSFFWPKELFSIFFDPYPIRSIFTPHGNSDKFVNRNWMQRYARKDICLIYGNHMLDYLQMQKVDTSTLNYSLIGNIRYKYYQEHLSYFLESFKKPLLAKLDPDKKNLLFAPTHQEEFHTSSFFSLSKEFFSELATQYNLIIKIHPALLENFPEKIYPLLGNISSHSIILEESVPIYPLLDISDAYIGDYSSIGYDFLTFNRPMFFIPTNCLDERSCYLHKCGTILPIDDITRSLQLIQKNMEKDPFHLIRKKMYSYTFQDPPNIKNSLENLL